ncbi:hypothetical protein ACJMK2_039347 [Sinanodonta woodiana]|uniref:Uncharacterized protein n=1 Tax=Sinanodonta woodiana TaxID=1069815 RepID=A0ABD3WBQ9_SINWO
MDSLAKSAIRLIFQNTRIPEEKKAFFKGAKTEIEYSQDGDQWVITVGMQGVPNVRTFRFKLGDSYDSESLDGSKMKSVMVADGDKFVEKHIDESLGAEMNIIRWIEGGKMIVYLESSTRSSPRDISIIIVTAFVTYI